MNLFTLDDLQMMVENRRGLRRFFLGFLAKAFLPSIIRFTIDDRQWTRR